MCGIAGIINFDGAAVCEELLNRMNVCQYHRGPDQDGVMISGHVGLAHRRLSIIDLANGRQPLGNEDDSVHIVFNGEIYNSPALREQLKQKGHKFLTDTDTEVIVHLYEDCGSDVVNHLNGMFAFAIYDSGKRKVLLARDRMGQKPLLYFRDARRFVFASEFSALKQHPDMPRDLNLQRIYDYFSLQYIPTPFTAYRDVFKLPPGYLAEIDTVSGHVELKQYWNIDFSHKISLDFDNTCELMRELLEDSVRKRLLSDVPFGAFLSGGIDSTIISGLMAKTCALPVNTFTIGFEDQRYDERRYSRIAVNHINSLGYTGLENHEKVVKPDNFDVLLKLVRHYGEPFCDASMLPTCMLSEFTAEHVTVALSGDGADELFAGYYRYLLMRMMRRVDMIPAALRRPFLKSVLAFMPAQVDERSFTGKLRRMLRIAAAPADRRYLTIINRFDENMKKRLCGEALHYGALSDTQNFMDMLISAASSSDPVEKIMEADIKSYLVDDILCKVDIASMANSLEVRSPFMDHRVVEFAARLPLDYKQHGRQRKHILCEAFKEYLPQELRSRGKAGFGVPLASWFRTGWDKILRERLLEGQAVKEGYLLRQPLETFIKEHQKIKADHSYPIFAMLMFELFLEECR
ncbi:MAG: asparagine synthase (glutamine-hydrolyzing) [Victivallales bacterium]|nr:asparagine synthase (glutamine-hydrolyzing) [Victivallales bacterium]